MDTSGAFTAASQAGRRQQVQEQAVDFGLCSECPVPWGTPDHFGLDLDAGPWVWSQGQQEWMEQPDLVRWRMGTRGGETCGLREALGSDCGCPHTKSTVVQDGSGGFPGPCLGCSSPTVASGCAVGTRWECPGL